MWCTRWFLPLLLLPLPTAPPYFLILFLFSLTMHAKPCFYCIVLLTTLFVSSCYWQPFPIDSPLTTPWADNITTFSQALNATLFHNSSDPHPTVIRAVDRCWCDFSSGGFFEPFNISHWEYTSVQRLKHDLERQQKLEAVLSGQNSTSIQPAQVLSLVNRTASPAPDPPTRFPVTPQGVWARLRTIPRKASSIVSDIKVSRGLGIRPKTSNPRPSAQSTSQAPHGHVANASLPLFRKEYDLRPYGLGIVIDLRWSR